MRATHDWAAGVVDGEGHIKFDSSLTLEVGQSSDSGVPQMLRRLKSLYGGTIYGPYRQAGNRKPKYEWHVYGDNMLLAIKSMWPLLGQIKRQQYVCALKKWRKAVKTPRVGAKS